MSGMLATLTHDDGVWSWDLDDQMSVAMARYVEEVEERIMVLRVQGVKIARSGRSAARAARIDEEIDELEAHLRWVRCHADFSVDCWYSAERAIVVLNTIVQKMNVRVDLDISVLARDNQELISECALIVERPDVWEAALNMARAATQYGFAPRGSSDGCGGEGNGCELPRLIFLPWGDPEWLLHEVGHFVAATAAERELPNYGLGAEETGLGAEREWQAWAFQEIILAPFGPARALAAPHRRDGVGFSVGGPIDDRYMRHAQRQIEQLGLDVDAWRHVYADWVSWGRGRHTAPWDSVV